MKRVSYIEDIETWLGEFSYFNPIWVRFSETDMYGHMNNVVPFIYFEETRTKFLAHLGFMDEWTKKDSAVGVIVADLQCDFLAEVFFGETIKVGVKAATVGRSSVDLHYVGVRENGKPVFVGRGTMVQINRVTHKGEEWSEDARKRWIK